MASTSGMRTLKMAGKGTKSDEANEAHAHPLTRTVHGPIKINVSVSGPVAVSRSIHMEACTTYLFLFPPFLAYPYQYPYKWNRN